MMISPSIRNYLKTIGQKGGKQRAKKLSSATLSSQARIAVITRWMRKRFGTDSFKDLALPGWEIIDSGIRDLAHGNLDSVPALVVAELRPRLRFLGVPVPEESDPSFDFRAQLYQKMKEMHGDMAYARFCALLDQADSFCHALASIISIPPNSSHRRRRWYT